MVQNGKHHNSKGSFEQGSPVRRRDSSSTSTSSWKYSMTTRDSGKLRMTTNPPRHVPAAMTAIVILMVVTIMASLVVWNEGRTDLQQVVEYWHSAAATLSESLAAAGAASSGSWNVTAMDETATRIGMDSDEDQKNDSDEKKEQDKKEDDTKQQKDEEEEKTEKNEVEKDKDDDTEPTATIELNSTFFYWGKGQSKLCEVLREATKVSELGIEEPQSQPLVHFKLDCANLATSESGFGTGNWVTALYMVRIAAALAKVPLQLSCTDSEDDDADTKRKHVLPWLQGVYPPPTAPNDPKQAHLWPLADKKPHESVACTDQYFNIPLQVMAYEIQTDMRRMAQGLVGDDDNKKPLLSNVELDEVAIHFRCGDVLRGIKNRNDFGILPFATYVPWISPQTTSIGIVTQSFDAQHNRNQDKSAVDACRQAVDALVDHLQSHAKTARITIRNGPDETLALAYARLVLARQSFVGLSSFGVFAVVGTTGEGYAQQGNRGVNPWIDKVPEILPNLHLLKAPVLTTSEIHAMDDFDKVLEWLKTTPVPEEEASHEDGGNDKKDKDGEKKEDQNKKDEDEKKQDGNKKDGDDKKEDKNKKDADEKKDDGNKNDYDEKKEGNKKDGDEKKDDGNKNDGEKKDDDEKKDGDQKKDDGNKEGDKDKDEEGKGDKNDEKENDNDDEKELIKQKIQNGLFQGMPDTLPPVVVDINHTLAFWRDGQGKLCQRIRETTGVKQIGADTPRHITDQQPAPLFNWTADCTDLATAKTGLGSGNWITAFYMVRIACALAQVDFLFQCSHGDLAEELLPWIQGYYPAPPSSSEWPYDGSEAPSADVACTNKYDRIPVDVMSHEIQRDMRRMALRMVGVSTVDRAVVTIPKELQKEKREEPLFPDVVLDDVAIHFRCGDVLGGANRNDFGIIKFDEYLRWISPEAQTLGILTQPFEAERNRGQDKRKVKDCKRVVLALVDFLQAALPHVSISIHNGPDETVAMAYARLIGANQTFTSLSSFGSFAVVGTFGEGYFQEGNRGVNPWLNRVPPLLPNLHKMRAPKMGTWEVKKAGLETTLEWLLRPREEEEAAAANKKRRRRRKSLR